LARPVDD